MKFIKRFTWVLLLVILCSSTLFVGCSDNDDKDPNVGKIDPTTVFTGKMPKLYGGAAVTYNDKGLVTKIVTEDTEVTFTYPPATKASNAKHVVRMTITDFYYPEDGKMYLDMTIGKNGYVESCKETYEKDSEVNTWKFGYNSDGQLNYMMRSENDNSETRLTYKNGDITKIEETSDVGEHSTGIVRYGTNLINKGCVMLFDAAFGIDMDEMQFAYIAGMLGKATKHLPVSYINENDYTDLYEYNFAWTLDSESYPVIAILDDHEYKFTWQ